MSDAGCFTGFIVVSAVVMLIGAIRCRSFLSGIFFSAVTGVGSLMLVELAGMPLNLEPMFNPLSAGVAAIYGIPGVIGLLIFRIFVI